MALEHKAFLFDFTAFDRELRPILESALHTGRAEEVRRFVLEHRGEIRDPYEGEELDAGWEERLEAKDAHQYGDFALTMYYDPKRDVGLGTQWVEAQEALLEETGRDHAVLGKTVGPKQEPFDPGKLGSYFQSEEEVRAHRTEVEVLVRKRPVAVLNALQLLLSHASGKGAGLYVTF